MRQHRRPPRRATPPGANAGEGQRVDVDHATAPAGSVRRSCLRESLELVMGVVADRERSWMPLDSRRGCARRSPRGAEEKYDC
jgi:hypothetical protein